MKKSLIAISTGAIFLLGACNKTKINSKRFMKAGEWEVIELSVEGVNEAELPQWKVDDCDIYEQSCMADWENEEGGHAEFVWQFRDKGETFEISYQAEEGQHEHNHAEEEAIAQAANFSGVYTVNKRDKEEMEFSSTSTQGFNGQNVVIKN